MNVIDWREWPTYLIEDMAMEYPPEIGVAVLVEILTHLANAINVTSARDRAALSLRPADEGYCSADGTHGE